MKQHISAGAVIIKDAEVLLLHRKATNSWHLPKGTVQNNESLEDTAEREVLEETGFKIKITGYLENLPSEYERNEKIISKTTHYFLAVLDSTFQREHDEEHDEVKFVPINEAIHLLTSTKIYEDEALIVAKAKTIL